MRIRSFISILLFVYTALCANSAFAVQDPINLLQGVTQRVMGALKGKQDSLRNQPAQLHSLVDNLIVPYVDFQEMSRWVIGRNAWQKSESGMQQQFVHEFKILVVRSYASSLLAYTNQKIEFSPLRGDWQQKDRIQVSSHIIDSGKQPVRMDYNLIRHGDSWRVYDIIIEGVSLLQGFRAQFSEDLRRGGLPTVVDSVKKHNTGGGRK